MAYHKGTHRRANKALISEKECFKRTVSALDENLEIPIRGTLTQKKIIETVVGMASNQESIHSIVNCMNDVPCETSLRHHLKKLDLERLQENNVEILTSDAISILNRRKPYKFAIDFTLDPFYGDTTSENSDYIIRSQKKNQLTSFMAMQHCM